MHTLGKNTTIAPDASAYIITFDQIISDKVFLEVKSISLERFVFLRDGGDYTDEATGKTNRIFTSKWVVKKMVDMLEEGNPGCFNLPDKTFADLYMKSGLYIAEIVTRLYQSEGMKKACPDWNERLHHLFAKQVYGLASTEIIYKIATKVTITDHNFRLLDALEYAKEGTLEAELNKMFG